jgi:hypothetical protein
LRSNPLERIVPQELSHHRVARRHRIDQTERDIVAIDVEAALGRRRRAADPGDARAVGEDRLGKSGLESLEAAVLPIDRHDVTPPPCLRIAQPAP